MDIDQRNKFRRTVWRYYNTYGRDLPWRHTTDPYAIMVSELMLQQTQVSRVIPFYARWMEELPTLQALAHASISDVLTLWSGLGYNRRATYLRAAAVAVMQQYNGEVPRSERELKRLPGIGSYTAAAMCAFAYNAPVVMIETNIRTVMLYHFYEKKRAVPDSELLHVVEETLSTRKPREWYWALMDYGVFLKGKDMLVLHRQSASYRVQPTFAGSRRQIRGNIVSLLVARGSVTKDELQEALSIEMDICVAVLEQLTQEGMVVERNNIVSLP